jgi:hypothetical protein
MTILKVRRSLVGVALATALLIGVAAPAAHADTVCTGDVCVVEPGVYTPAGMVTVSVSPTNVVSVHLTPLAANTFVFGVAFEVPPGPPGLPGYTRTSITTASAGTVIIDTLVLPPGASNVPSPPTFAIISIHPPGPCRVRTVGTTVTFTPIVVSV